MAIKLAIPHNWFLSRCKSFASQFIRNMLFFCDIVFSTFSAIEYFAVKIILVIQNSVKITSVENPMLWYLKFIKEAVKI